MNLDSYPVPQALSSSNDRLGYRFSKRLFDLVLSFVILVATAPILLLAIIAIRLDSPGPALFRQQRMGRDGRVFQLVKLRGMYVDSTERFPDLYEYGSIVEASQCEFFFHRRDDPRVTRVGRVIRKYSVDELPNFWNVLRGEMSVVGPRPEIPELCDLYGSELDRILSVRPGVTSPAKAVGRDEISFAETLKRDLEYVERRSFGRDLITVIKTALSVVSGSGVR